LICRGLCYKLKTPPKGVCFYGIQRVALYQVVCAMIFPFGRPEHQGRALVPLRPGLQPSTGAPVRELIPALDATLIKQKHLPASSMVVPDRRLSC
jgi:hypothetical protein